MSIIGQTYFDKHGTVAGNAIDEHSGEVISWVDGGMLKEHFGVEE